MDKKEYYFMSILSFEWDARDKVAKRDNYVIDVHPTVWLKSIQQERLYYIEFWQQITKEQHDLFNPPDAGSQARQDAFVLSLIDVGTFLDIGCYYPASLNNTIKLEANGWTGLAIDIVDYSDMWKSRTTPFVCADALTYDFTAALTDFPDVIDYLSLDVEGDGDRYKVLVNVLSSMHTFKIITIEHDRYKKGHLESEATPQRELLTEMGYFLLCEDVIADFRPFEDWWVNPKYVDNYMHYKSKGLHCDQIMKLI